MKGSIREDQDNFFILSRSIIFKMKNVEKIKTHLLCSILFFPKFVPFMR